MDRKSINANKDINLLLNTQRADYNLWFTSLGPSALIGYHYYYSVLYIAIEYSIFQQVPKYYHEMASLLSNSASEVSLTSL